MFVPAISWLGNPSNLAVLLLLACLVCGGRWEALRDFFYGVVLVGSLSLVSTVAGLLFANEAYIFNPSPFAVFLRIQICYLAIRSANDLKRMHPALLWMGLAASGFAVGQFYFPSFSDFTRTYYLAPERIAVFGDELDGAAIVRVIGPYENPSSVALAAIVLALFAIHMYWRKRLSFAGLLLCSALTLFTGLLSLSKIFFIAAPLLLLQLVALGYRRTAAAVIVSTFIAGEIFFAQDSVLVDVVRYSLNAAVDPTVALQGRYIADQMEALSKSPIFGYGLIELSNVVINDSAYLFLVYLVGGFGLCVLGSTILLWILRRRSSLSVTFFLTVATILLAGVGSNSILGYRLDIFLSALCSVLYLDIEAKKTISYADHCNSNV